MGSLVISSDGIPPFFRSDYLIVLQQLALKIVVEVGAVAVDIPLRMPDELPSRELLPQIYEPRVGRQFGVLVLN